MSFDRLWAPWRLEYVTGQEATTSPPTPLNWHDGADHECFLCRAAAKYDAAANADRQLLVPLATHIQSSCSIAIRTTTATCSLRPSGMSVNWVN